MEPGATASRGAARAVGGMNGRGRLCFHSSYLLPVLAPWVREFAGGIETQLTQIMRGLRDRDFDVNLVTCDYGQPPHIRVDDIGVYRSFPPDSAIPIVRFFHPRLTRSVAALNAADAEVYYVNGRGFQAGVAYDVARWRHAGSVIHMAADLDVQRSLPEQNLRDRWWHRRALRGADLRIAQTEYQRDCLQKEFGLSSDVIRNVVEIPPAAVDPRPSRTVVWLGTYKHSKRPEWFTALARDLPEYRFVMAGVIPPPPLTQDAWHAALDQAARLPNLEVRGFLDHEKVAELFRSAALLVHTSPAEGFSNVLIEAWAHGLPTVACVDPDRTIERFQLGAVVTEYEAMVAEAKRLLADPEARAAAGSRAREYAIETHSKDRVIDRLAAALDGVVERVRRRRAGAA